MDRNDWKQVALVLALFVLALAAVLAFASPARAVTLEAGAGITKYSVREPCNIWSQCNPDQLETHNELRSVGYQIGARWDYDASTAFRVSWVNLGHFYANNTWTWADSSSQHSPLNCPQDLGDCRFRGKLSGSAYGVAGGPVLRDQWGAWRGELEVGAFVYRSYQTLNICPIDVPSGFQCFDYNRMWGVHKTWYAGTGIGRGPWSLNWRVYHNVYEQGSQPGYTGGWAHTLFVNFSF